MTYLAVRLGVIAYLFVCFALIVSIAFGSWGGVVVVCGLMTADALRMAFAVLSES